MSFYARMQDTALRLITDKGVTCQIVGKPTSGGFDPITGAPLPKQPATTQTAQCVLLDYAKELTARADSLIETSDKKILIAAKGVDIPKLTDTIKVGDKTYIVMEVINKNPDTTPLIYEVRGRE